MDTIVRFHILVDSNRGVYIPQEFAKRAKDFFRSNYKEMEEDLKYLINADPYDSENYWDVWVHVLDNFYYVDEDGNKFHLEENCDLFGVMDGSDLEDFYE